MNRNSAECIDLARKRRKAAIMGIAKFNRVNNLFTVKTDGFKFMSLKELYTGEGAVLPIKGLYINPKGKYGASPFAAGDGYFISLPSHLLEVVRSIMDDAETVDLINAGKCGLTIRTYQSDDGAEHYTADFVDV